MLKGLRLSLAVIIGLAGGAGIAQADQPVAHYDFDDNATRTVFENAVDQAPQAGFTSLSRFGATTTLLSPAGSGIVYGGPAAGVAIGGDQWQAVVGDPGPAATDYLEFTVNLNGLDVSRMRMDFMRSTDGPGGVGIAYSTNGVTFAALPAHFPAAFFSATEWDLHGLGLEDQPAVVFRIYGYQGPNGAFAATGTLAIDNVLIFADGAQAGAGTIQLPDARRLSDGLRGDTGGGGILSFSTNSFLAHGPGTTVEVPGEVLDFAGLEFRVQAGATLSFTGTATTNRITNGLVLEPGSTIRCTHASGINGHLAGTGHSLSPAANYVFARTAPGPQVTGTLLPPTLTGTVTVELGPLASDLFLSFGTTFSDLRLVSGVLNVNNYGDCYVVGTLRMAGGSFAPALFEPVYDFGSLVVYDGTQTTGLEWRYPFTAANVEVLSGDVTLAPIGARYMPGTLTLSGGNLELSDGDLNVDGVLALASGSVRTGTYRVAMGPAGTVTQVAGYVEGTLSKYVPLGSPTVSFELGAWGEPSGLDVSFDLVDGSPEVLTASLVGSDHPDIGSSGLDPTRSVNEYWTVTNSGVSFDRADLTFHFGSAAVDGPANPAAFVVRKRNGAIWFPTATGLRTATSTQATDITSFSEFAVGEVVSGPNVIVGSAAGCISLANPCQTVPVLIDRTDATGIRAYSVPIQLSPELELCGSPGASITEGSYLSSIGTTLFQVVSNGGGSYTVDCAILGSPCGATASSGALFNVAVKQATGGSDGTGSVAIGSPTLRDCANANLVVVTDLPSFVTIDTSAPAALSTLASAQVTSGNDGDGTTKVTVTWSGAEGGSSVEVYRKGFGSHPEYDDAGGAVPTAPATPAAALGDGWTLTGLTASGGQDEPPARDFWYYVAFVADGCGNVSAVSNLSSGALNYHLGDVSDGVTPGAGNNLVGSEDISLLGANYGLTGAAVDPVNYLDIGPTTDLSISARPTTDNAIEFDDFILFAINYGEVSAPGVVAFDRGSLPAVDRIELQTEGRPAVGEEISTILRLEGSGRLQGVSVALTWNPRVVEPIGSAIGRLASDQGAYALSSRAGAVDVALLGARDIGLAGVGDLATVRFRVVGAGDPAIALGPIRARDRANREVPVAGALREAALAPGTTQLLPVAPNPTRGATALDFALARAARVELSVCSVNGRKLRTLLSEERQAGVHHVSWDGTDDAGRRLAPGVYYATFLTEERRQSRAITIVR